MLDVGGYSLEVDAPATAAAYARGVNGPETCGCWYCRNWVAGRDRLLPAEVADLLGKLGVPRDGEVEVWQVPGDGHPHGYGGWYTCVGRIVSAPPEASREFALGGWHLRFVSEVSYAVKAFDDQAVFQLQFFTWADDYIDAAELHVV
jgi:hypothetical protein